MPLPFQESGRRPAEAGHRRYHLLATDGGVPGVAAFFGVTPEALYELTLRVLRSTWGEFRATAPHTFYDAVIPGRPGVDTDALGRIAVPIPDSELGIDLVTIHVRDHGATLERICADHNRKRERAAAGMPPLTPHAIWHMVVNAPFREVVLAQHESEAAQIDRAPGGVVLPVGSTVLLPYPALSAGTTIHAVPGARGNDADTTTASHVPRWAWTLKWLHLDPIERLTKKLDDQFERARAMAARGAQQTLSLGAIRQVLGRMKDEGARHPTIGSLDAKVEALQNAAARVLVVDPLRYADPGAIEVRRKTADDLLAALGDAELATGVFVAFTEPDTIVDHASIRGQTCSVLLAAWSALARTTKLDVVADGAKAALEAYGTADTPSAAEGKTATQVLMSIAGSAGGIVTNGTANLPGPASLAGSLLEIVLVKYLPDVAHQGAAATGNLARLRAFIMQVGKIAEPEMAEFQAAVAAATTRYATRTALRALREKVGEKFFASARWGGFMSVLNLFALYSAFIDDSADVPLRIMNVVGGGANSAVAVRQFLASLGATSGAGTQMVLETVGVFASVITLASGILQVYEGVVHDDMALVRGGLMSAVGGGFMLAGYALMIPGLEAIGVFVLIVSASIDIWQSIVEGYKSPTARVFRAQLAAFGEKALTSEVGRAMVPAHAPLGVSGAAGDPWVDLFAAITACGDAITAADAHLVPLRRGERNISFLRQMGFADADVENMLEPIPTAVPLVTPVGMGL